VGKGLKIIEQLVREKPLFRERDVRAMRVSPACLHDAKVYGIAVSHGHGVWSHPHYIPTRYELLQVRFEDAVFWGPSALWLLGETRKEPEVAWLAIAHGARPPRTLDLSTVVVRTRNLEKNLIKLQNAGRVQALRVHSLERARADVAANDCAGLISRTLMRRDFTLAPDGYLLTSQVTSSGWPGISPARPYLLEGERRTLGDRQLAGSAPMRKRRAENSAAGPTRSTRAIHRATTPSEAGDWVWQARSLHLPANRLSYTCRRSSCCCSRPRRTRGSH
jgi:hypothetical protein